MIKPTPRVSFFHEGGVPIGEVVFGTSGAGVEEVGAEASFSEPVVLALPVIRQRGRSRRIGRVRWVS